MGRSVDYLSNAEYVIYFTADWINGEEDYDLCNINWDDFKRNLVSEICNKLKSYYEVEEWDGRETMIFLKNELAEIGISEYCGLYSLSIRVKDNSDYGWGMYEYQENLGKHHCQQIRNTLEKCLVDSGATLLNRVGTFSNGTGVFEKKGAIYDNSERIL